MWLADKWGAALYILYLHITVGNAFRFGLLYMVVSAATSFVGFAIVIHTTHFWQNNPTLAYGMLFGLVLLPVYFGILLKQKNMALQIADLANIASRAKGQFASTVSHELRTPLTSIIALSNMINKTSDTEKITNYADKIQHSGNHLLSLINNIIDYQKIENNKLVLSSKGFDLHNMVNYVKEISLPLVLEKDIQLTCYIHDSVPLIVKGDVLRLSQVLLNLVTNAIKFTEQGTVALELECLKANERSRLVRFSVTDTGIGINMEKSSEIFNVFSQSDESITRKYGGAGLGLAISKEIVERMGGKLQLESTILEGSTFWFDILLNNTEEPEDDEYQEETIPDKPALKSAKILIAEDDTLIQEVYQDILSQLNADITVVDNGKQALETLRRTDFDIAIIDHHMPVMSGLETIKTWRNEEHHKTTPIILLTADVSSDVLTEYEAYANAIETKPILPDKLISLIFKYALPSTTS